MNGKLFSILIILFMALLAVGYYFSLTDSTTEPQAVLEETFSEIEEQIDGDVSQGATLDIEAAKTPRILGDANAPIKISEHSSLTCGHCGKFHREVFKDLKAKMIDTGKAYLVFSDFPLNAPALHATMAARCLPDETRYFDFVQMLFEQQESWAYEKNYLNILKSKAAEYGLSNDNFKACLENEELQKSIVDGARAAQSQWNVSSTPSFVINNKTLIAGSVSADTFIENVNKAVAAE